MKKNFTLMLLLSFFAGGLTAQDGLFKNSIADDNPPQVIRKINNFAAIDTVSSEIISLSGYFADPDDPEAPLTYEIIAVSHPEIASASVDNGRLAVTYSAPGQSTIIIQASNNGLSVTDTFAIAVWPLINLETGSDYSYVPSRFKDSDAIDESFWNGSDESGGFISGEAFFHNNYNADWFSWSGWAYSNISDNETPGWGNQYSAFPDSRLDSSIDKSYAVAYASPASNVSFADSSAHLVKGVYITNSTYAGLTMKKGDAFSKKFGGESGNDEDWFKLAVAGYKEGKAVDTIEYLLADYTSGDNSRDQIIETWQWLELSSLGKIDSLRFNLSSSDNGDWGMNTPAYFCMDNMYVLPDAAPYLSNQIPTLLSNVGQTITYDLANTFSDPDDPDEDIKISLIEESWSFRGISPELTGTLLKIDLLSSGATNLGIRAESNGKVITTSFLVDSRILGNPLSENAAFNVYPNPTKGIFRIDINSSDAASVEIYTLNGSKVREIRNYSEGSAIDISDEKAGIYIMKIQSGTQVWRQRILKR